MCGDAACLPVVAGAQRWAAEQHRDHIAIRLEQGASQQRPRAAGLGGGDPGRDMECDGEGVQVWPLRPLHVRQTRSLAEMYRRNLHAFDRQGQGSQRGEAGEAAAAAAAREGAIQVFFTPIQKVMKTDELRLLSAPPPSLPALTQLVLLPCTAGMSAWTRCGRRMQFHRSRPRPPSQTLLPHVLLPVALALASSACRVGTRKR
mmetsp:Transcript_24399/g.79692  ORF Transcript_24399/g.79692 Transcript_24399/m.79692 type:complete len:203 (-) Transcript_24399:818-1426(-)